MAYYKCGSVYTTQNSNTVIDTASGSIANFSTQFAMPLIKSRFNFEATQEAGTPTPQSPKAISGVSAVGVYQRGSNLWDEQWELGSISTTNGTKSGSTTNLRTKNNIKVLPNTKYSFVKPAGNQVFILFYDKNDTAIQYVQNKGDVGVYNLSATVNASAISGTFTTPANTEYILFRYENNTYTSGISINYPSTDTDYHAYNPNSNATLINLGGTYYGGYVEQDKDGHRELVVTHGLFEFDGSNDEEWNKYTVNTDQTMWRTSIPERKSGELAQTGNISSVCNRFERATNTSTGRIQGKYAGALTYFDVIYNDASELTDWRAWLANNPIQLAVELSEPYTVALPDGAPIKTIPGINNIYADTGDTSLQFIKLGN